MNVSEQGFTHLPVSERYPLLHELYEGRGTGRAYAEHRLGFASPEDIRAIAGIDFVLMKFSHARDTRFMVSTQLTSQDAVWLKYLDYVRDIPRAFDAQLDDAFWLENPQLNRSLIRNFIADRQLPESVLLFVPIAASEADPTVRTGFLFYHAKFLIPTKAWEETVDTVLRCHPQIDNVKLYR